jgi:hypothetical protein
MMAPSCAGAANVVEPAVSGGDLAGALEVDPLLVEQRWEPGRPTKMNPQPCAGTCSQNGWQ